MPMKMEQTMCSETSPYKIQTQGNYPEESIEQTNVLHPRVEYLFSLATVNSKTA